MFMRRIFRVVLVLSLIVNVIALPSFCIRCKTEYDMKMRVRALSKKYHIELPWCEYRIVYADDLFWLTRTYEGAYMFGSTLYGDALVLSFESPGINPRVGDNLRYMISAGMFFASWQSKTGRCDHVVFQYNDIGRKYDLEGNWNIKSGAPNWDLFCADNVYQDMKIEEDEAREEAVGR